MVIVYGREAIITYSCNLHEYLLVIIFGANCG